MKLAPELIEQVKGLLGGRNLTQKRMAELMRELEQRRVMDAEAVVTDLPVVEKPDPKAEPVTDPAPTTAPPSRGPEAASPDAQKWEHERKALYDQLQAMNAKIEEMRRPVTEEERGRAMMAGVLPVETPAAATLGYAGSQQLPQGVWFMSPLGPKIQMKLCGCDQCKPHRRTHYFCVECRTGPHHYLQRYPGGRMMWLFPGGASGIVHECCTQVCWTQYQSRLGVQPGVNDHEPLAVGGESSAPDLRRTGVGSD